LLAEPGAPTANDQRSFADATAYPAWPFESHSTPRRHARTLISARQPEARPWSTPAVAVPEKCPCTGRPGPALARSRVARPHEHTRAGPAQQWLLPAILGAPRLRAPTLGSANRSAASGARVRSTMGRSRGPARSLLVGWAASRGFRFAAGPCGTSLGEFAGPNGGCCWKLLMGLRAGRFGLSVALTGAVSVLLAMPFRFFLPFRKIRASSSIDSRKLELPKPAPPSSGETGNQIWFHHHPC
jgi:hypothetical protein